MENQRQASNAKYALGAFFAVVVFVITYKYALNQVAYDGINDLREHMWHADNIYLDRLGEAWLKRPYLFWHLCVKGFVKFFGMPLNEATACACACFAALCYFVTFFIVDRLASLSKGRNTGLSAAGISCALGLVMPFYMYWFNAYHYEGQFSINPMFNPTHMAVKPFGLLAFLFAVDLIRRYRGRETVFCKSAWARKSLYVLFGAALFMSAFTKPTFMYMLVPAGVVYMLVELAVSLVKKDGRLKEIWGFMWRLACACAPALLYLAVEYAAFYFWGGTNDDAGVAVYPFLYVWRLFSPNVPKSILLAMAFPFFMVATNLKYFLHSVEGRLGLIGYAVGVLEFSFFVETGDKLGHCNFSWPMMSGMLLLWVVAGAKLAERTCQAETGRKNAVVVTAGWALLILHLFSGLYYINPYQYII